MHAWMCMCVCLCGYECARASECACVCACAGMSVHMHAWMCMCVCLCGYECARASECACVCSGLCALLCTCAGDICSRPLFLCCFLFAVVFFSFVPAIISKAHHHHSHACNQPVLTVLFHCLPLPGRRENSREGRRRRCIRHGHCRVRNWMCGENR